MGDCDSQRPLEESTREVTTLLHMELVISGFTTDSCPVVHFSLSPTTKQKSDLTLSSFTCC